MIINVDATVKETWWDKIKKDPERLAKHYAQSKKWKDRNKESEKQKYIRYKLNNPEQHMLTRAKTRAKKRGLDFNIELSDIIIPEFCPIMKEPLQYIAGKYSDYSPSLDRIDSTKGYIKGNVWVISSIANRMKWDATKEQLNTFAKGILSLELGDQTCLS